MELREYLDDLVVAGLKRFPKSDVEFLIEYLDSRNHARYTPDEVRAVLARLQQARRIEAAGTGWIAT